MTPYVEKGGKSLMFDRRFRHVGRIKKASGTADPVELAEINKAFADIAQLEPPRLDVLRAVQDGIYTPREVWQAFRRQRLDTLLSTKSTRAPLFASMEKWIDGYQCSEKHRVSLHQSLRYFRKLGSKRSTIEDLPRIVDRFREEMNASRQGRTFNLARSCAQAFVRSTMKRNHPIYLELGAIEILPVTKKRENNPQTPDELRELMKNLAPHHAKIAWAMAVTGMGPLEYWGRWSVEKNHVRILGTKRDARRRSVPIVDRQIEKPSVKYRAFQKAIEKATDGKVEPYDMRRSFATWMEDAGIQRTRRKIYMGHGPKDVTDIYEKKDVERYWEEDGAKLRIHAFGSAVDATEKPDLHIMKGGAN